MNSAWSINDVIVRVVLPCIASLPRMNEWFPCYCYCYRPPHHATHSFIQIQFNSIIKKYSTKIIFFFISRTTRINSTREISGKLISKYSNSNMQAGRQATNYYHHHDVNKHETRKWINKRNKGITRLMLRWNEWMWEEDIHSNPWIDDD
jgi:hypothetical protein